MRMHTVPHVSLGKHYQGDTFLPIYMTVEDEDVEDVCVRLRTKSGGIVHTFDSRISGSEIELAEIPQEVTMNFPVGMLYFDAKMKIGGYTYTIFTAQIEFLKTRSNCVL